MSNLRYYKYISISKIDMLAGQIPRRGLDGITSKIEIDLKVLSGSLEEAADEDNVYSKLNRIEQYLTSNGLVGTLDSPKQFIQDKFTMAMCNGVESVLFFGQADSRILILGGSAHHVIGGGQLTPTYIGAPSSAERLYYLISFLGEANTRGESREDFNPGSSALSFIENIEDQSWITPIYREVTFLIKVHGNFNATRKMPQLNYQVILGSPVFVAEIL